MYLDYFGLTEAPFSIAPDPHFLYLSQRHQEALAHLLYGIQGDGGFVLLSGEVGSGKTTICRCLLEQIPANVDVAYVFNPKLTAVELLATLCTEIGIPCPADNASIKVFIDRINEHLLEAHAHGRHTVLIIDEAQNLSIDVLEQMRLLTNLETNRKKLLQIILIGQPELLDLLARDELRQLSQRIIARFHLDPLSKDEIAAYVSHRLEVSGGKPHLIPASLAGRLFALTGGVPRIINVVCDRALLGAYAQGLERVDKPTLEQAAREVLDATAGKRRRTPKPARSAREWRLPALRLPHLPSLPALPRLPQLRRPPNPFAGVRWGRVLGTCAAILLLGGLAHWASEHDWQAPATVAVASPAVAQPAPTKAPSEPEITVPDSPPQVPASDPNPSGSRTLAYASLFQQWKADFTPGPGICRQAEAQGLRCQSGQTDLEELLVINRPAVLILKTDKGKALYATLTALGGDQAKLLINGRPRVLAIDELNAQWNGDYTLLWRPPSEIPRKVQPGEQGDGVRWVARQLALWQGSPAEQATATVLEQQVLSDLKAFQRASGLRPDGTAGAQTLLRLASLGQPGAPVLTLHPVNTTSSPEARNGFALRTATELTVSR